MPIDPASSRTSPAPRGLGQPVGGVSMLGSGEGSTRPHAGAEASATNAGIEASTGGAFGHAISGWR
jgi:hypothetical protein